jgi:bifunctional DNase/RNase
MRLVDLFGVGLDATSGSPVVVLREHERPNRILPILIGGSEATAIAAGVTGEPQPRPRTHDLMVDLLRSLEGHLDGVLVTELIDGTYLAYLTIHGPTGHQRIDTRPSDAIALAVRLGAPVFVSEAVLDQAGSVLELELDENAIDEEVEQFRAFLDHVDPSEFAAPADQAGDDSQTEDNTEEDDRG